MFLSVLTRLLGVILCLILGVVVLVSCAIVYPLAAVAAPFVLAYTLIKNKSQG